MVFAGPKGLLVQDKTGQRSLAHSAGVEAGTVGSAVAGPQPSSCLSRRPGVTNLLDAPYSTSEIHPSRGRIVNCCLYVVFSTACSESCTLRQAYIFLQPPRATPQAKKAATSFWPRHPVPTPQMPAEALAAAKESNFSRTAGSEAARCEMGSILYSTPLYSTILYNTIQYYTILYYTILYYTILYYTILYYTILYYTILYYTILYYTILYYTILYYTILYYTILYYTILYYTILYYTILYYTILYLEACGT